MALTTPRLYRTIIPSRESETLRRLQAMQQMPDRQSRCSSHCRNRFPDDCAGNHSSLIQSQSKSNTVTFVPAPDKRSFSRPSPPVMHSTAAPAVSLMSCGTALRSGFSAFVPPNYKPNPIRSSFPYSTGIFRFFQLILPNHPLFPALPLPLIRQNRILKNSAGSMPPWMKSKRNSEKLP